MHKYFEYLLTNCSEARRNVFMQAEMSVLMKMHAGNCKKNLLMYIPEDIGCSEGLAEACMMMFSEELSMMPVDSEHKTCKYVL